MSTVLRFAPSPTGYLHIGGARTALFNYIYAKSCGGKFLLRIEDTDQKRSTKQAVDAIINGLSWLGIMWDGEPVFQASRGTRHAEVAHQLLRSGHAYKCYCTPEDLAKRRTLGQQGNLGYKYDGRCRALPKDYKSNIAPAIRLKVNQTGKMKIHDLVFGNILIDNSTIDDFVLLRGDNTATYMLAVVVDDHDMGITHIVRGNDHLNNAFRQYHLYKACYWQVPQFAHIPLILDINGNKLSKRTGSVSLEDYKNQGFLPQAIRNYLLRLGWSHGDEEIISDAQAISWFDIKDVNKSPARFDIQKLSKLNSYYLQNMNNADLVLLIDQFCGTFARDAFNKNYKNYLIKGLTSIKARSKTIKELVDNSSFYLLPSPFELDETVKDIIKSQQELLKEQLSMMHDHSPWDKDSLLILVKSYGQKKDIKLKTLAEGLRACLCGKLIAHASNFEIMEIIGKEETIHRIKSALSAL